MRRTKEAFLWIIEVLHKNKIPYLISGGFVTRIYGSKRRLADIDIEIPDKYFKKLVPIIKDYIVKGPNRYVDSKFDVYGLHSIYKGQAVDFVELILRNYLILEEKSG